MSKFGFKLTMFFDNVSAGMKVIRGFHKNDALKAATTIEIKQQDKQVENQQPTVEPVNSKGYQKEIKRIT